MTHSRRPLNLDEARIRRLHDAGYTCNRMAPLLGCCPNAVRRVLKKLGLHIRPYRAQVCEQTLRRLHAAGWSVAKMAAELGTGHTTICRRMQALGLHATGINRKHRPG